VRACVYLCARVYVCAYCVRVCICAGDEILCVCVCACVRVRVRGRVCTRDRTRTRTCLLRDQVAKPRRKELLFLLYTAAVSETHAATPVHMCACVRAFAFVSVCGCTSARCAHTNTAILAKFEKENQTSSAF